MRQSSRYLKLLRNTCGALAVATSLVAGTAQAIPATFLAEGVLTGAGGTPAVDGDYAFTFGLFDAETGGNQLWSEGPATVAVKAGRFAVVLGGKVAVDAKTLAAPALWLEVKAGTAALPRVAVHSTLFARTAASADALACSGCVGADHLANGSIPAAKLGFAYAGATTKGGAALDLSCTGCVGVAELAFDGDVDLGGNSIKAKNGTFGGDVVAKTVTATAFVGDGSKLTGIAQPIGACPNGQAVTGIAADGTLKCAPGGLVPDGLNEVSNELLTNQFVDKIGAKDKGVAIPDNTGAEAVSNLDFPDIGVAQALTVEVELANTDLATVAMVLLPPNDKKVGYTLCDPCGDKDAKSLKVTYPTTKPKSGDLAAWVGQNPTGGWTLKVKDTSFCLVQVPGNEALCDVKAKTDGKIVDWSITIQTLSSKKVQANGELIVTGKLSANQGDGAGPVGVANGKIQPNLVAERAELAGNRWKQCTWKNLNDGTDEGQVVTCPYTKKYDNTALRIVWDGTLRSAYNCNACCKRWFFTVNGTECAKPGQIEGVAYTWQSSGAGTDLHHHKHIEGFCSDNAAGPIKKGDLSIGFWIGNCAGYSAHDGYTGWNSTSRVIIEEVPM